MHRHTSDLIDMKKQKVLTGIHLVLLHDKLSSAGDDTLYGWHFSYKTYNVCCNVKGI